LLKKYIFLGAGPDAFAMVFPQNDIAGKINWLRDNNMLVDKPHNWYLQVAINTGMISLLALLAFLAMYLFKGIRLKNEPALGEGRLIHIGIMSGVVGYCVAGLANDSNVSVAPVFWVMLGLGLSYVISAQQARTARLAEGGKTPDKKAKKSRQA
jgi:O-antigen ligase